MPDCTIDDAPSFDSLIIPGGPGLRDPAICAGVAAWIGENVDKMRRIACVCTGIYGLAPTGLLDGRRVTTHWRFAADVQRRFPRLIVEADAIFLVDDRFYTSGGVTAGIDLALALVECDVNGALALAVAREMLVYLKRPGGQSQFSVPLRFQTKTSDRFADLINWVGSNLSQDLSVSALADRACLSPRQFQRRFVETFDCTVAAYVEQLRLAEACIQLIGSSAAIESVAASIGFRSADSFRRAFERKFGIGPTDYRRRFTAA
jgi:transcriptional regulator GlxA family with amidase domain